MTRGLMLSVALHIVLVVFTIMGLPRLFRPEPLEDRLMVVDVVTVGSVTNAPPPAESSEKPDVPTQTSKAKPQPANTPPPPSSAAAPPPPPTPKIEPPKVQAPKAEVPKAEPPKPQTARSANPPAEPLPTAEPVPAPKPQASASDAEPVPLPKPKPEEAREPEPEAVPLPKPKPEVARKPEPEPEPPKPDEAPDEAKAPEVAKQEPPKPEPETVKAAEATPDPVPPLPVSRPTPPKRPAKEQQVAAKESPAPEKEPEKQDDFLNVLKTVQKMKDSAATPAASEQTAAETTDSTARRSNFDASRPLSVSEMDAIRQQIAQCWLVPAGAKEGESLVVEIQVRMNPDRTVREADVVDDNRMRSDPFFRAAAESALRALRNPSCTPLNLPPEKYETWKSFTITFDPRDMLS